MASDTEIVAMRRAIALAREPVLPPQPNPRVGCVILSSAGEVVGEGYHRGAGTAHAEQDALAHAGSAARGSTAVVTLEPCRHVGRTGPCVDALVAAGIRRVVLGQLDPDPVAGGGADSLRAAGVDVEVGVLECDATALNREWSFAIRQQRPFVTWKFAATLDGRSAAADGTSQWITGTAARRDVHRLRAACDAILVGSGTVAADNPRLTVRDDADSPLPRRCQPLRVVMGNRELDPAMRVFDASAATVMLRTHDPGHALGRLHAAERRHVWLEGGPRLAAAFLAAGLVDEVVAYLAPALLGGGRAAVADLGITTVTGARRFELADVARVGTDVRVTLLTKHAMGETA
jgi:diaminohydroxyphosphoribosylaminopyrimidine deaminase / 5-amino-6-(5-phosphoribosylamino)uracil reductase